jgi:hypothetical protein
MNAENHETRQWALASIVFGALMLCCFVSMMIPMTMRVNYVLFMFYGAFFSITIFCIYNFARVFHDSIFLKLSALSLIIAGVVNTLMSSMQGALRMYFRDIPHDSSVSEATRNAWSMGMHAGNAIQLGVDVAYDIFLLGGFILIGAALLKHPFYGKWLAWPAMVIGVCGLLLNLWTYPTPPGEAGLFDGGFLIGLWFLAFVVQTIRVYRQRQLVPSVG